MRNKIKAIVKKYGVRLVSLTKNIQGTYDIELDINIYYKAWHKYLLQGSGQNGAGALRFGRSEWYLLSGCGLNSRLKKA